MTATDPSTAEQQSYIVDLLSQAGLATDHVPSREDIVHMPGSVRSNKRVTKMARKWGGMTLTDLSKADASWVIDSCKAINTAIASHNSLPYTENHEG